MKRAPERAPCALANLGVASALGRSIDEIWPRLVAGDASHLGLREDLVPGNTRPLGAVRGELPELDDSLAEFACRNNQLAQIALAQIAKSVATARRRFGAERIGVVVGTSTSGIAEAEAAFRERAQSGRLAPSFRIGQLEHGGLSDFVARSVSARGPCFAISTACSSSAKALGSARALLELGLCDAVIAGGVDSLCRLTASGFGALHALSAGTCNPMSRNRDGLTLGEAAALFLVTRDAEGVQLAGVGESSDAHHMSAPEPSGLGVEACMRAALADAGASPDAIAYLNLHGTGTAQNDAVESHAVERVFGRTLPCSSTKPLVGHTLGASGALEAAFCWMILARREQDEILLPPHRWDEVADPNLASIALTKPGARGRRTRPTAVMSNSFGFGGSNCSLVLREGAC